MQNMWWNDFKKKAAFIPVRGLIITSQNPGWIILIIIILDKAVKSGYL